jgi:galactonate dehydratase
MLNNLNPSRFMPGFGGGAGSPELNVPPGLAEQLVAQMRLMRQECGPRVGLRLDLNFNFKTDGFVRLAQALTPEALGGPGLEWLELDTCASPS